MVETLRGDGKTKNLPDVIEKLVLFSTHMWQGCARFVEILQKVV